MAILRLPRRTLNPRCARGTEPPSWSGRQFNVPLQIGSWPSSRALYGLDVMLALPEAMSITGQQAATSAGASEGEAAAAGGARAAGGTAAAGAAADASTAASPPDITAGINPGGTAEVAQQLGAAALGEDVKAAAAPPSTSAAAAKPVRSPSPDPGGLSF